MKSYLFSCGNSTRGSIGFCARVNAESKEQAQQLLREALPDSIEVPWDCGSAIHYIRVYFNGDGVKLKDIEDVMDGE